ncbi:hypothetical protein DFH28DRAFT_927151 [Melampsora americana]|nr:hypothetical protein DFH28DRAFT_927151 [Melampsora americana]
MRRGQTQGWARITHAEKRYTRAKDNVGAKVAQGQSHGRAQVNPRLLRKPRTVTYSREANTTEKQIVHMGQGQADPENSQWDATNHNPVRGVTVVCVVQAKTGPSSVQVPKSRRAKVNAWPKCYPRWLSSTA